MNSYQVLVGPYDSETEAESAHANLVSRGFRPRSYERGSRSLTFFSGLTSTAHACLSAISLSHGNRMYLMQLLNLRRTEA